MRIFLLGVAHVESALGEMGEKAATSEVISRLVSALGDENSNVRASACVALGEMGEKAATSEVISKLVSALGDENSNVRESACDALGKMGEKAATSEVISKLASALGDEDSDVRRSACDALAKMGEKAATSEVISKLVSALGDEDSYVRRIACDALAKMGEKAATSEVINKLLVILEAEQIRAWYVTAMLEKLFTSFTMMTALDVDTVRKLLSCLDRNLLMNLRVGSPEVLVKVFLHTHDTPWLSIVTRVTLLEGIGITIGENTIAVYHSKEPVMLECSDGELVDQLVKGFVEQALRLDLPCMCSTKARVSVIPKEELLLECQSVANTSMGREKHSSTCNVL